MHKSTVLIAAGLLAGAGALGAAAAVGGYGHGYGSGHGGHRHHGGMMLRKLDTDNDRTITLEEFMKPKRDDFTSLDANKDGVIDANEIVIPARERGEYGLKRLMKRMDQNADGKVSKEEFARGAEERFAENDLNSDGKLTAEDRPPHKKGGWFGGWHKGRGKDKAAGDNAWTREEMKAKVEERFKERDANGDGVLDEKELAASHTGRVEYYQKKAMHRLDKDNDGKVSLDEYTKKSKDRFSSLDLNSDGKITLEDLPPRAREMWDNKDGAENQKTR